MCLVSVFILSERKFEFFKTRFRRSSSVWVQLVYVVDATSDQFSVSVVTKPLNTLPPIVYSSQLFEGQSRTFLSSTNLQVSEENKCHIVAVSVVAVLRQGSLNIGDVSQRNYFTPADHDIESAVHTHDEM